VDSAGCAEHVGHRKGLWFGYPPIYFRAGRIMDADLRNQRYFSLQRRSDLLICLYPFGNLCIFAGIVSAERGPERFRMAGPDIAIPGGRDHFECKREPTPILQPLFAQPERDRRLLHFDNQRLLQFVELQERGRVVLRFNKQPSLHPLSICHQCYD
jgi:hypothetical protein